MTVIVHWTDSESEPAFFQNIKQVMINSDKSLEMLTFKGFTFKFGPESVDSYFVSEHSKQELE